MAVGHEWLGLRIPNHPAPYIVRTKINGHFWLDPQKLHIRGNPHG
jgi:hypothetical protein